MSRAWMKVWQKGVVKRLSGGERNVRTQTPSAGEVQVNDPEGGEFEAVEGIGRAKSAVAILEKDEMI